MKIAIMQPYFFPYLGYFQLINAVDKFIFYDDVNYIKQGWINRNNILIDGKNYLFTLKLRSASSFKLINEIEIMPGKEKLLKTIIQSYSRAPYFNQVMPLIIEVFTIMNDVTCISKIAEFSVKKVAEYLDLKTIFETSSEKYNETKDIGRENRILTICQKNCAEIYINSFGGQSLYDKTTFSNNGIKLLFIKNQTQSYRQFNNVFVPGLSIIDVLMFNDKIKIIEFLENYELI